MKWSRNALTQRFKALLDRVLRSTFDDVNRVSTCFAAKWAIGPTRGSGGRCTLLTNARNGWSAGPPRAVSIDNAWTRPLNPIFIRIPRREAEWERFCENVCARLAALMDEHDVVWRPARVGQKDVHRGDHVTDTTELSPRDQIKASFRKIIDAEDAHRELCEKLALDAGGIENLDEDSQLYSELGNEKGERRFEFPVEISALVSGGDWTKPLGFGLRETGAFVSIRPCAKEHEGKTFLGIYLGDLPIGFRYGINPESGVMSVAPGMGNPAIWVPALKRIVYGCESWWGPIKSPEDVEKMQITDDTIQDIWYVKMLRAQFGEKPSEE